MKNVDTIMNIKAPRAGTNQGAHQAKQVPGRPDAATASNPKITGSGGDSVTLTQTAAEMLKLEQNLAKIPDVDSSLVDSIKSSISEGTYRINPEDIANRLLAIEKESR